MKINSLSVWCFERLPNVLKTDVITEVNMTD